MIRRLRWKFIAVNMSLVAVVLIVVFAAICVTTYRQQQDDGLMALRLAMMRDANMPPEKFAVGRREGPGEPPQGKPRNLYPIFSVTFDEETGEPTVDTGNVEVSEELLAQAVEAALATGAAEGVLRGMDLRFLKEDTPMGQRIAFLDISHNRTVMTRQALTLGLVGLGGLTLFFGISFFLANWALRPVEKAWAQQQQFVADASHELKTPLTVILANLGILRDHPSDTVASQDKWIENTQLEATRMRRLVDGLLFLAKSGAVQDQSAQLVFSLTDVIWRAALSFEPVAYEQGITLTSDITPDLYMVGDASQITQLATVLLDNACKYAGEHGAIAVTLSRAQEKLRLTVSNTGVPIPAEELPRVFERFYRTDKSRAHTKPGYGLGLAIGAEIVKQHGGRISAQSDAVSGTVFTVLLPLYKEKSPQS